MKALSVLILSLLPFTTQAGLFDSHSDEHTHSHTHTTGTQALQDDRPLPQLSKADQLPEPVYANDKGPKVLATIHPLAMVAASIVPESDLSVLLPPGMTPHDFSMRPSDIDRILNADIIIWAGPSSEPYMEGLVARWPDKHWISATPEELEYPIQNPHWWLSPELMKRVQKQLAALLKVSPVPFTKAVDKAVQHSRQQLEPVKERGFLVFHNAYEHWVNAVGIHQLGVFTETPEHKPGLRSMNEKRELIASGAVACVFVEPEFSLEMVDKLLGDRDIPRGMLDAQGLHVPLSANAYPLFLMDLSARAYDCLSEPDDHADEHTDEHDDEHEQDH